MRTLWISLLLLYNSGISAQSYMLDETYGEDGIAEIDTEANAFFWTFFAYVDSLDHLYINSIFLAADASQGYSWAPLFRKLDNQGRFVSFDDISIDTTLEFGPRSYGHMNVAKDKIYKYYRDTLAQDTFYVFARFDLELDLEASFKVDFGGPVNLLFLEPPLYDESHGFVNVLGDSITSYLPDGSLDESFGGKGYVLLDNSEHPDFVGSFSVNSRLARAIDGDILISSTQVFQNDSSRFEKHYLSKLNPDGSYDHQFGNDGTVASDALRYFDYIPLVNEDGIYMRISDYNQVGELCSNPLRSLARFTHDGLLDTDFAKDGYHIDDKKLCFRSNYSFHSGPEGKIAYLQRRMNEDNTFKHMLGVIDKDGENDPAFNSGRLVQLEFIDERTSNCSTVLDKDFNLYVICAEFNESPSHRVKVAKLKAKEIWNHPEYDSPFVDGAFSLFPNPTNSVLHIEYDGPEIESPVMIKIFDILGQEIFDEMVSINSYEVYIKDFSALLSQGTYFVQLRDEQGRELITEKFTYVE